MQRAWRDYIHLTKGFVLRNPPIPSFYHPPTLQQIYSLTLYNLIHSQIVVHLTCQLVWLHPENGGGIYYSLQALIKSVRIRSAFFQAVGGTELLRRKGGPALLPGLMLEISPVKTLALSSAHAYQGRSFLSAELLSPSCERFLLFPPSIPIRLHS